MTKQGTPTFKLTFEPLYRFEVYHDWENETSEILSGWCAVGDSARGGIIAYFGEEDEAYAFVEMMRAKHNCDHFAALYMRAYEHDSPECGEVLVG